MKVKYKIFNNFYQDSVSLIQIFAQISKLPGIQQVSIVIGMPDNLEQLRDTGLGNEINASPSNLMTAVMGEEGICSEALVLAQQCLTSKPDDKTDNGIKTPEKASLEMALEAESEANLAPISVPRDYAAAEAMKALNLGMDVAMFNDNVSIGQEKSIKTLTRECQRIVMEPDYGTTIVSDIPLDLASMVKHGVVDVIGVSGTGLQEVTYRISQFGAGAPQVLGAGGYDLSEEIGGIPILFTLDALAQDDEARVVVLISKPSLPIVVRVTLGCAEACGRSIVVSFLDANPHDLTCLNITAATTPASAAGIVVALLNDQPFPVVETEISCDDLTMLQNACQRLSAHRQTIRGVFAGGTFCYEAQLIRQQKKFSVASDTPVAGNRVLANIWQSEDHTLIDVGDDDFTRGKPYPTIDSTLRNQRLLNELNNSHTAVVLFDLVLGYGASMTPASELLGQSSHIDMSNASLLIAYARGTEVDPQIRSQQISALQNAGVIAASSNAQVALQVSTVAQTQLQKKRLNV